VSGTYVITREGTTKLESAEITSDAAASILEALQVGSGSMDVSDIASNAQLSVKRVEKLIPGLLHSGCIKEVKAVVQPYLLNNQSN